MNGGNGHHQSPTEISVEPIRVRIPVPYSYGYGRPKRDIRSAVIASILFVVTVFSTLAVGTEFASA